MSDKNKIHIELIKEWLDFDVDPVIRQRGLDYFTSGHIENFQQDDEGKYVAIVIGTDEYNVWFKVVDSEIYSSCNCPFPGDICKHQVAVAYAISEGYSPTTQTEIVEALFFPEEVRLQKILDQFTPEEIRKELFSILLSDEELFNNFTNAHEPLPEDRRSIRRIVLKALQTGADTTSVICK
ncbi:MAG: SWIM zinc finger family protein [Anaerolineaceae bacterium]|nr:SWIM zinc finger family protein [Anaerolineaceae bacterium]